MYTTTLPCPLKGLLYEKHEKDGRCFYSLSPNAGYRMRVCALETADEHGKTEPLYLSLLAFPRPYDFSKNEQQIESEAL